jgi:hypothetical protein
VSLNQWIAGCRGREHRRNPAKDPQSKLTFSDQRPPCQSIRWSSSCNFGLACIPDVGCASDDAREIVVYIVLPLAGYKTLENIDPSVGRSFSSGRSPSFVFWPELST